MGYKDCKGWFAYIPPRHKKRISAYLKTHNKGRKKDSHKYLRLEDAIQIMPFRTEIYA